MEYVVTTRDGVLGVDKTGEGLKKRSAPGAECIDLCLFHKVVVVVGCAKEVWRARHIALALRKSSCTEFRTI